MTTNTTVTKKAARRKLNLLELAGELEKVSKACRIMGYSRQQFYISGRTTFYESVQEMQDDFDKYLEHYNEERSHQGRNMNGRTPYQAFIEGINPSSDEPMEMNSVA